MAIACQVTFGVSCCSLSQHDKKKSVDASADPRGTEVRFNLMSEHAIYAVCLTVDCCRLLLRWDQELHNIGS